MNLSQDPMPQPLPFAFVLQRIRALAGEEFQTTTGLPFTYRFDEADRFCTSRTNYPAPVRNLEAACALVPSDGPGTWNRSIRAPAYVWGVLHDPWRWGGDTCGFLSRQYLARGVLLEK